jgi:hypothetical protein
VKSDMIRKVALASLAAVAAVFPVAIASPALASQGSLCTTFGSGYCVGGAGNPLFPGELTENVNPPGRTIVVAPGPGGTGTLHSSAQTGLCLAPASSSNLVIEWRNCTVTGVSWTWVTAGTSHYFVSVHYSGLRLTGDNAHGDPLAACPSGGCSGGYVWQQWNGP